MNKEFHTYIEHYTIRSILNAGYDIPLHGDSLFHVAHHIWNNTHPVSYSDYIFSEIAQIEQVPVSLIHLEGSTTAVRYKYDG